MSDPLCSLASMAKARWRKPRQEELPFRSHGGRRKGAGRKRGNRVSHDARPKFHKATPVHVTLRMREYVWNLRSCRSFRRIRRALAAAKDRFGLRIIEFCVLGNHVHLLVEADDDAALSRGIQGLAIRIAKALNAMMKRAGKVFADHFHSRLLRSPTELVRAIQYVLKNAAHHYALTGPDAYSSDSLPPCERVALLSRGVSWLLRVGIYRAKPAA